MKKTLLLLAAVLLCSGQFVSAKKATKLKTQRDSVSYALGLLMGQNMNDPYIRKLNVDMSLMQKGMADVLEDKTTAMDRDDAYTYLMEAIEGIDLYSYDDDDYDSDDEVTGLSVIQNNHSPEDLAAMAELDRFFEETRQKPGVIELESGVLYEILEDSDGQQLTMEDRVAVGYVGMQIDGTIVDEDPEDDPFVFYMPNIVDELSEALTHFSVGGRYRVYYPVQQLMKDDWYEDILEGFPVIMEFYIIEVREPEPYDYHYVDRELRYRFYDFETDQLPDYLRESEPKSDTNSDYYLHSLTELDTDDFSESLENDPYKVYAFDDRFFILDEDGLLVLTSGMNEISRIPLHISDHRDNELIAFLPKDGEGPVFMMILSDYAVYDRGTDIIAIEGDTIVNRGYFRITQTRSYDSTPYDQSMEITRNEDGYRFRLTEGIVLYQQNGEEIRHMDTDIYYTYTPGNDIVLAGPGLASREMQRLMKNLVLEEVDRPIRVISFADLNGDGEEDLYFSEYGNNNLNIWIYRNGEEVENHTFDLGKRFALIQNNDLWKEAYILCGIAHPDDSDKVQVDVYQFADGEITLVDTFDYEAED